MDYGYINEKVESKASEVKSLKPPDIQGVPKKGDALLRI